MGKKKIKSLIVLGIVVGVLSSAMVGCSSKNNDKTTKSDVNEESKYSEPGTYPVVKEPITVTAFAGLRPGVSSYDYDKNSYTKHFTDKFGINFKWQTSTASDAQTKRNAMITSGTYPDLFFDSFFTPEELLLYGEQGILIPLNDLIDKYAPNYKKMLEDYPTIKQSITSPDGNMYALSKVGWATHMRASQKMWINKVWLDNLGLEMPTTTDEFYEVLKAFKEKDPNGNGIADEIPLSGSTNGWGTKPENFLMNAFVPYNIKNMGLFLEDGTIKKTQLTERYKKGVEYLNKLYEEGLMDNLTYSQNNDQLKKIGTNPGDTILGCYAASSVTVPMDTATDRWLDYVAVPPLKGPDGEQNIAYIPETALNVLSITDKCKDPIAVILAFDSMFQTEDFSDVLWNLIGEKGIDYKDAEKGEVNFIGEQATYKNITKNDEKDGRYWNQIGPYLRIPDWELLWTTNEKDVEGILYNETVNKYLQYKPDDKDILPVLVLEQEDSRRVVDIRQAMDKYVDESFVEFVIGEKDIDKEWKNYLKELDKIGSKEYIEIYQKAYEKLK